MTALDEAAKSASAGRAVSREPTRQDDDPRSLTSQVGEPGLPLAFGDVERPVRPVRRVQAPTEERAPIDFEKLLVPIFLFAAVCILMFTVVRLWGERAPAADVQAEEVPVAVEAAPVEPPPEAARHPCRTLYTSCSPDTGTRAQAGTRPRGGPHGGSTDGPDHTAWNRAHHHQLHPDCARLCRRRVHSDDTRIQARGGRGVTPD